MKKFISCLLALVISASFATALGCAEEKKLEISDSTVELNLFDKKTLTVDTNIEGQISWTNSNDEVLFIDASNKTAEIEAIGSGSATVTAKIGENSVSCAVTVNATQDTLELELTSQNLIQLNIGDTSEIGTTLTFKDQPFVGATIEYEVLNAVPSGCVTVNNGVISAVADGSATVKAIAKYRGNQSNAVNVSVVVVPNVFVNLEKVEYNLYTDERYPSTATIAPKFNVGGTITDAEVISSESTDDDVAIYADGMIKAIGVGEATITLNFSYEELALEKVVSVVVKERPNVEFNISDAEATVDMRDLYTKHYNAVPDQVFEDNKTINAIVKIDNEAVESPDIVWTSSVPEVATVVDGVVTGLKKGETTITAKYTDTWGVEYTKECVITVNGPIYYGQHERYAVDGMVAEVHDGSGLIINNVSLTETRESNLIRFQYVPDVWEKECTQTTIFDGPGFNVILVSFIDAENPTNYITVGIRQDVNSSPHYVHKANVGARVGAWGAYGWDVATNSRGMIAYKSETDKTLEGMTYNTGFTSPWYDFSMHGIYLSDEHVKDVSQGIKPDCDAYYPTTPASYMAEYEKYMMGISVVGTKIYINNGGKSNLLIDLGDLEGSGLTEWEGFSSDKVNIMIKGVWPYANATTYCSFVIDTLGGQAVTAANVNNDVYYTANIDSDVISEHIYPKN